MKQVPLSEIKDDLSRLLREAETQGIVITRHGKPAGVLIGFESEGDWFEYRLENSGTGATFPFPNLTAGVADPRYSSSSFVPARA